MSDLKRVRQVGNVLLQRDGTVVGLTTKPEDAIARMQRLLVGGRSAEELLHERLEKAMQRLEQAVGIGGAMKQAPPEKSSLANWSKWSTKLGGRDE
ncbi:MAG: hypothetical protein ACLPWF_13970 [Bryobacteraceae bacterium]|jgi:hypothetical protein